MTKLILVLAITLFTIIASYSNAASDITWKTVEQFSFDWDQDGQTEDFKLDIPTNWNDPGIFTRVTVKFKDGRKDFVLNDLVGEKLQTNTFRSSEAKSEFIAFKMLSLSDRKKPMVMIIESYAFASSPGELVIASFNADKKPVVLYKKLFDMAHVQPGNEKRNFTIYGRSEYGGCLDKNETICDYSPTIALALNENSQPAEFVLDPEESKAYNLRKNYPWLGPKGPKDIMVHFQKPKIISDKQAKKLIQKANKK